VQPQHLNLVTRVGVLESLRHKNHLFDDLGAAVGFARDQVRRAGPLLEDPLAEGTS